MRAGPVMNAQPWRRANLQEARGNLQEAIYKEVPAWGGHQEATLDIVQGRTEGRQQNDVRGHSKGNARKLGLGGKRRDVCSAQAQQATVELNRVPLCSTSTFRRQPCST
jgi:hypothetical protein